MNQAGSALIIVVTCIALVTIGSAALWQCAWYAADIVYKKQLYEQQMQSAQGLLTYACAVCKQSRDMWKKQVRTTWERFFEQWPCGDHKTYSGSVHIAMHETAMNVQVYLTLGQQQVVDLGCTVGVQPDTTLIVDHYKVHGT